MYWSTGESAIRTHRVQIREMGKPLVASNVFQSRWATKGWGIVNPLQKDGRFRWERAADWQNTRKLKTTQQRGMEGAEGFVGGGDPDAIRHIKRNAMRL